MVHIKIEVKGLDELQRKLADFPGEIHRIRREIFAKYKQRIELEARHTCPTEELKDSVKIESLPDGNFKVRYNPKAKQYVEPVIQRNTEEMHKEIAQRIGDFWQGPLGK